MASLAPIHAAAATTRAGSAVCAARPAVGHRGLSVRQPAGAFVQATSPPSSAPAAQGWTVATPRLVSSITVSTSSLSSASPLQRCHRAAANGMLVTAAACTPQCGRRTFYDKIRDKRDGSEAGGPEDMFQDFAKSTQRQQVPAELHKSSKAAVDHAEQINAVFCVVLLLGITMGVWLLNPFRTDPYERPEGYGTTDPLLLYGSSDRVQGNGGSNGGRYGHQTP